MVPWLPRPPGGRADEIVVLEPDAQDRSPSEAVRAVKAATLGATLGAILLALARMKRQ